MDLKDIKSPEQLISLSTPSDIKTACFELDENYMYALTRENSDKALACIQASARYRKSPYEDYYKQRGKSLADYTEEEIRTIVKQIANSNSTRTPNCSIDIIAAYMAKNLTEFLQRLHSGDVQLVEELGYLDGFPRHENSLASKICSYLSRLEYGKSQYVINDSVVREILPYYLKYYEIPAKEVQEMSYAELLVAITELSRKTPDGLACHEIDQILWYGYRDDPVRRAIAVYLSK